MVAVINCTARITIYVDNVKAVLFRRFIVTFTFTSSFNVYVNHIKCNKYSYIQNDLKIGHKNQDLCQKINVNRYGIIDLVHRKSGLGLSDAYKFFAIV